MRVLGLVTARGGSRGFPGKSLALLAGRPLVAWTHRLLVQLRRRRPELDVALSTDDPRIADAWPESQRPRRLRPARLATDAAASVDVVRYELDCAAEEGRAYDAVLLVQPTSPLLAVEDLEAAWRLLEEGCPCAVGVTPAPCPVQWSHFLAGDGVLQPVVGSGSDRRRQEQAPAFVPCGFYMSRTGFLREHGGFLVPGATRGVVVAPRRAVDIDAPIDLEIARSHLHLAAAGAGFEIQGRRVGEGEPAFVIAELGVNHNGDVKLAGELIDAAADAGATAVKFQTFLAAALATPAAPKARYQEAATGAAESQLSMLERLELPRDALADLKRRAESRGLVLLSTPFDPASLALLLELGVPAIKLASGELTHETMLAEAARSGRPLIVSTGMAALEEVEDAAATIRMHGDPPVAWLHCVSSYPAPPGETNLRAMESLRLALGGPAGLSDHTPGAEVAVAAAALGAAVIEKHLTLSRGMAGPDHGASLEPEEFREMVRRIRLVESARGDGVKRPTPSEADTRRAARRSLVAVRDLPEGSTLRAADVCVKRPGTGLPPAEMARVVGRALARPVRAHEPLTWRHFQ